MNVRTELKINNTYAKKSLGQNFLHDENVLNQIVEFANVKKDDNILEIGPGLGSLTKKILDTGANLTSIEIDKKLVDMLKNKFADCKNFNLVEGDFLKLTKDNIWSPENSDINILKYKTQSHENNNTNISKYKCVANIPYYITSPIIMRLLSLDYINDIIIMVQKEVCERIFAKPSTKNYGVLTLAVKYYAEAIDKFDVSKFSFTPVPNVDSSVLKLVKYDKYKSQVHNEKFLFSVIKGSFSQRRKKLANALSATSNIDKNLIIYSLGKLGFSENTRAEELNLDNFIDLANMLN